MAGSQSTKVEIPDWLKEPTEAAIGKGEAIGKIGYVPYYGPDVAAFTGMQNAAFDNTSAAAQAFGLGGGAGSAGMPAPQTFAGGVQGYSSAPIYEQAIDTLTAKAPGQVDYINSFFIDPVTGQMGGDVAPVVSDPATGGKGGGKVAQAAQGYSGRGPGNVADYPSAGYGTPGGPQVNLGGIGGYNGLWDMVNGGGPGAGAAKPNILDILGGK